MGELHGIRGALASALLGMAVVAALAPLGLWLLGWAKRHRGVAVAAASLMVVFGVGHFLNPPPPPRLEAEEHDEDRAGDDEPKDYSFRPATAADLPMLARWLRTPLVMAWWGDPEEQYALLEEDLANPLMTMRIVSHLGRPFAYAQDYDVHSWPQPHYAGLPPRARSIDSFIGEPGMIGRGHGPAFLRLLARRLIAEGAPVVAIDPDVENARARRAYLKAGFRGDRIVETGEGPAVLMTFER